MELQQLKEIATKLNYQHHHNIGANKLEEQLRDYCKNELNITLEEVMKDMVFEPTKDEYAPTSPKTVEEAKKEIKEETICELFKDEVRAVGEELGIPHDLVWRQPFPGPGLAIRVMGDITKDKLDILRDADWIFREEIANAGLDRSINQYFAVLTNTRTVGVMGDFRTYDYTLALRGVTTTDFMTADWARIPYEVLDKISSRIVNEVQHINRIVYDITSKPPATIEWE